MSKRKKIGNPHPFSQRFRGFLPIVIDIETAGFDPKKDALLELAAVFLHMNEEGFLHQEKTLHYHVEPFEGANLDQSSLDFNGIRPFNPFRQAQKEAEVLADLFSHIHEKMNLYDCHRAIMVAHNAAFDQSFLKAAVDRHRVLEDPFHLFSTFDTVPLCGLAFGQTVLAKAAECAGLGFDKEQAHSARYDAELTAELFCRIVNQWKKCN